MIGQQSVKLFQQFRNVAQVTLFPLSCRVCDKKVTSWEDGIACGDCWAEMETKLSSRVRCEKCGLWRPDYAPDYAPDHGIETAVDAQIGRRCGNCEQMVVTVARSVGPHEGSLRESVLWLKRYPRISRRLQNLIREAWSGLPDCEGFDAIIPIPLHPNRLAERSFNQAAIIGELIGAFSGARLDTTSIFRRKMTERHRLGMGFDERLRSMRDAFGVSAPRLIRDRRLLLIDDVLTTGSTADEAARTLLDSGAREVSLLTISRANYRANSLI
ncbi:MAG: hypothetical protein ACOYLN_09035 [Blastocatellia bacterium]